jgi:hypothetical protein
MNLDLDYNNFRKWFVYRKINVHFLSYELKKKITIFIYGKIENSSNINYKL